MPEDTAEIVRSVPLTEVERKFLIRWQGRVWVPKSVARTALEHGPIRGRAASLRETQAGSGGQSQKLVQVQRIQQDRGQARAEEAHRAAADGVAQKLRTADRFA